MQGSLLVMCICWKYRQRRLGVDDFGHPHDPELEGETELLLGSENGIPGLAIGEEDPAVVSVALAAALGSAVEADFRSGGVQEVEEGPVGEETPLLGSSKNGKLDEGNHGVRWSSWFERS